MKQANPTEAVTFRLERSFVDALRQYKEREGVGMTEQVRRALREWLGQRGINIDVPKKVRRSR